MSTLSATPPLAVVLMGVAGSGKSAVGVLLAEKLGAPFLDGDDFHPRRNVEKMASGTPLEDDDRWPWLDAIAAAVAKLDAPVIVVACSALKRVYRERLAESAGRPLRFILLDASRETLARRLVARRGHFMPASLLDSQLATLEPPGAAENAVSVSAEGTLVEVVDAILVALPEIPAAR